MASPCTALSLRYGGFSSQLTDTKRLQPAARLACLVVRAASSQQPGMRSFDRPSSSNNTNGTSLSTSSVVPSSSISTGAAAVVTPPPPPAPSSYRVSVWQAMQFNGPVPERVNGRLAMMAFLYIAQREMQTGLTVIEQAQRIPQDWSTWPFIALMLLFVYAAFPPALVGAKEEDFGIFSVRAEKTNGRAAMLGLAVLAALEYHSGFCFF